MQYTQTEIIIEVALILFYSLTYLLFGVSELDFWRSGVVNRLVCGGIGIEVLSE